jgi:hypothetical protein
MLDIVECESEAAFFKAEYTGSGRRSLVCTVFNPARRPRFSPNTLMTAW